VFLYNGAPIEVQNLVKKYGDLTAVDGISFKVNKGEVFSFLGPNGAGKTTTVEILECLRKLTNGEATVLGLDVKKAKDQTEIRKRIGVLPQDFNTFELLTVRETLQYYGKMYDHRLPADDLIKLIDLEPYKDMYFQHLSGGLKQRTGVAVALVNDPELVFLDEPTTGLDPKARREVWDVIRKLKGEGKTVFLTSHYMEEAEVLSDRIAIILSGKIVAEGAPRDLVAQYGAHPVMLIRNGGQPVFEALKGTFKDVALNENGDVSARLDKKTDLAEATQILTNGRLVYDEIEVRRSSMEDVFLNITGKRIMEGELN
jgi:ABC-2 type transport system ATP-binding protein